MPTNYKIVITNCFYFDIEWIEVERHSDEAGYENSPFYLDIKTKNCREIGGS